MKTFLDIIDYPDCCRRFDSANNKITKLPAKLFDVFCNDLTVESSCCALTSVNRCKGMFPFYQQFDFQEPRCVLWYILVDVTQEQ